jgi:DNA-binding transcriptional ArsR family regulator
MASLRKALSDENRRMIMLLVGENDMITTAPPTDIAKHFNFSIPSPTINLRIIKDAELITERREGRNKLYSLNTKTLSELVRFFDHMHDSRLKSLKD